MKTNMEKSELREKVLKIRNGILRKSEKSAIIMNNIFPLIKKFDVLGIFVSMENEVNTIPIITAVLKMGKTVAVPVVSGDRIDFYKISGIDELQQKGKYNIREPLPSVEKIILPQQIQVIVCPGIAFDKDFNRLGYGKGYYDKYLCNTSAFKIGICFSEQLLESVPADENDVKMDCIVTEKRIIKK